MSSSVGWKRLLAFGAGGVALLIIGGLAASAVVARVTAHGGDPGAIRLCVHAGGWVQVVGPSEACPPNFTAQDVSIEGPQGPPGADGQDGAQGPPGGVAPAGQGCPAQQFVSGFDQDGNIVCSAVLPQTQTMEDTLMGLECFDLDTGEIIPVGSFSSVTVMNGTSCSPSTPHSSLPWWSSRIRHSQSRSLTVQSLTATWMAAMWRI